MFAATAVASTSTKGVIEEQHGFLKGGSTRALTGGRPDTTILSCDDEYWDCENGCISFVSCKRDPNDSTKNLVTVDVSGCKDEGKISWACCTGSNTGDCVFSECEGEQDGTRVKCNDVSSLTVSVDASATSITINAHDGKAKGTADPNTALCGGNDNSGPGCQEDGTTFSKYCLVDVEIPEASCGCTIDEEVRAACVPTDCEDKTYNTDTCECETTLKEVGTLCGEQENMSECRLASKCDAEGSCVAPTAADAIGLKCRDKDTDNDCDVDDFCDGTGFICPQTYAKEGSSCGSEDFSKCIAAQECSDDGRCLDVPAESGTICREAVDGCDIEERCDGSVAACPCDDERDDGYTMKCGQLIYLCGPEDGEITYGEGGQFQLGDCVIGKGSSFVSMPYPECLDDDLQSNCPKVGTVTKSFGLSNYATATCSDVGGKVQWTCTSKANTSSDTKYPIDLGFTSVCSA